MNNTHKKYSIRRRLESFRSHSTNVDEPSSLREKSPVLNGAVYYTFAAYLFVTTIILSDAQILTADTGFTLPIISLSVPFLGFFILAPLALLALHTHALGGTKSSTLQPDVRTNSDATPRHGKAIELFFFLFSPMTLTVVFWRLADYQDVKISSVHAALVAVDLWLSWNAANAAAIRLESTKAIKNLVITLAIVATAKAIVCWDVFVPPWPDSVARFLVVERDLFRNDEDQIEDPLGLIPNINIDRTKLLFEVDVAEISSIASLHGYERWQDYFDDRGVSVDIRDRSLRLSYLHGQTLPRMWAHNAQLQGSNLSLAFMPGAVFVNANLQDAYLELTNLDGAYLDGAILRESILIMTRLRGASLDRAQLQGAHIRQSDFTAAWLPHANFGLSPVLGAKLSGAYLEGAHFWGSLYDGPPQFIVSNLEGSGPLDISAPTNAELQSWRLTSPVRKISDLKGENRALPFFASDQRSVDAWIDSFCKETVSVGDEAAV